MGSEDEVVWELPGYELLERIALGGRGAVYLARENPPDGPLVAVKVLRSEDADRKDRVQAFIDEVNVSTLLIHPNIVRVYHGDIHLGLPYLVMEHVDGLTLWDLNERARFGNKSIPCGLVAYMAGKVAEALAYSHELTDDKGQPLNLVHRDVSAVNVMATFDGAIKLLDFGIARHNIRSVQTAPGIIKGKLDYLSPEQCEGGVVDAITDIYSLGVMMFELTTGTRPYTETDVAKLFKLVIRGRRAKVSELRDDVPPPLEAIIDKAMATKRGLRHQSARELHADIHAFLCSLPEPVTSTSVAELMVDLAPELVSKVAEDYGTMQTTSMEQCSELIALGRRLDGPMAADLGVDEPLKAFYPDEGEIEETLLDQEPLVFEQPADSGFDAPGRSPGVPAQLGRAEGGGVAARVLSEQPTVVGVPVQAPAPTAAPFPARVTSSGRRRPKPLLLFLLILALFSFSTLVGIAINVAVRGPLIRGDSSRSTTNALILSVPDASASREPLEVPGPPPEGTAVIRVSPRNADVFLDGERAKTRDGLLIRVLDKGTHKLRVTAEGKRVEVRDFEIGSNKVTRVRVRLRDPIGTLTVKSRHPAMLYVGRQKIGLTPVVGHELEPGRYDIKIVSRRGTKRKRVSVRSGELTDVHFEK